MTAEQKIVSTALVADIRKRWGHIPLIGHNTISPQSRQHCPGPGFPMEDIDRGAGAPPPPAGVARLAQPFSASAQHVPMVFYHDWSFGSPAYTSGAKVGTVLQFDAWAVGPAVVNLRTKQPYLRWFHRYNPHGACGWCPGAWVIGEPKDGSP